MAVAILIALSTVKETVRITISAPGVPQPVVVSDPRTLALSNVFAGTFIGAPAAEPDRTWPRATLVFDIQAREGVKVGAYTVWYARSRWTGEGFVYLPGPGEPAYRANIATILRTGQDGAWHHASIAWSEAINAHLP